MVTSKSVGYSQTLTFFQRRWRKGNVPIMRPRTHGLWLGSTIAPRQSIRS
jgi:branched-chain amino acid aminotransferase